MKVSQLKTFLWRCTYKSGTNFQHHNAIRTIKEEVCSFVPAAVEDASFSTPHEFTIRGENGESHRYGVNLTVAKYLCATVSTFSQSVRFIVSYVFPIGLVHHRSARNSPEDSCLGAPSNHRR